MCGQRKTCTLKKRKKTTQLVTLHKCYSSKFMIMIVGLISNKQKGMQVFVYTVDSEIFA